MSGEAAFVREFFAGADPYPMYVQEWGPADGERDRPGDGQQEDGRPGDGRQGGKPALVFIHGGSHSGVLWTTAPDGSPGWARLLAARGWRCFTVDWPGSGRSGCAPQDLPNLGIGDVAAAVADLLDASGPAILVGHSIGAAISYKTAERAPGKVRAIVALGSAPTPNGGIQLHTVPITDPGKPARSDLQTAQSRLASSDLFPHEHIESYCASLVSCSPRIRNGALGGGREGANEDFRVDDLDALGSVPILFVTAVADRTSPPEVSHETAKALGAEIVSLDHDWGLPGHGHMFPIERGNDAILERLATWMALHA